MSEIIFKIVKPENCKLDRDDCSGCPNLIICDKIDDMPIVISESKAKELMESHGLTKGNTIRGRYAQNIKKELTDDEFIVELKKNLVYEPSEEEIRIALSDFHCGMGMASIIDHLIYVL